MRPTPHPEANYCDSPFAVAIPRAWWLRMSSSAPESALSHQIELAVQYLATRPRNATLTLD